MPKTIIVSLASNEKYWQGVYNDSTGRRRKKGIGAKSELSQRQARKLFQELANDLSRPKPARRRNSACS